MFDASDELGTDALAELLDANARLHQMVAPFKTYLDQMTAVVTMPGAQAVDAYFKQMAAPFKNYLDQAAAVVTIPGAQAVDAYFKQMAAPARAYLDQVVIHMPTEPPMYAPQSGDGLAENQAVGEGSHLEPINSPPVARPKSGHLNGHNLAIAFGIYLAAALALHISNIVSTQNRVFDPHQLISDEMLAWCLALAVLAILPRNGA